MGDGIKYVFEIDGQTPGVDALIAKLERSERVMPKVAEHTEKAGKAHDKHSKSAEHLGGVLDRLTNAVLHPLAHKLKEIAEFEFIRRGVDFLIDAPAEAFEKFKELGEEMIEVAAKAERTNKSFDLLFGASEGKEVLEYLEGIAKYTEFTDERLKGAAQSLAKVGFEGKGLTRALAASLDIAAFSSDKEGGFSDALSSLERIRRTGHVDNRVLGGLGIGQDDFLKELSARTGKGTAVLKKEMAKGKVAAQDALESLYSVIGKKTGKELGGAGVEMGKTLSAHLTHIKDLPEQFFQKLANTAAFDQLNAAAERFMEKLDPESATGKKIFEGLEAGFKAISDAIDSIDIDEVAGDLKELASDIKPTIEVLRELADVIINIGRGIKVFGSTGFDVLTLGLGRPIAKWSADQQVANTEHGGLLNRLKDELNADKPWYDKFTPLGWLPSHQRPQKAGLAAAAGMSGGMDAGMSTVEDAASRMGDAASGALQSKLEIHSPSKVFERHGRMSGEGYADGVLGSSGQVDEAVSSTFAAPTASRGGGGLGGTVSVSFGDIHVGAAAGANAHEQAMAFAAELRTLAPSVLADAFEQVRLRDGS